MVECKHILRRFAFLALLLLAAACVGCVWLVVESSFASRFSLSELVQRNQSNSGLDCSSGGGIGAGTGGVGSSGTQSSFHKGESCSCRISDAQQFDEAKFIQALKESIEKDLGTSGAKITGSQNTDATSFSIEYTHGDGSGRVEISGTRSPGYYSLSSKVDEKSGGKSQ